MIQVRLIDGSRSTYRLDPPLVNPYLPMQVIEAVAAWDESSDAPVGYHVLMIDDVRFEFAGASDRAAWLCGVRFGVILASQDPGYDQ